jgi:hypothetical protein
MFRFPDNIPEAPPAPVISRSGLVDEVEDEEEHHQSRRQKSVQQPDQEQKQSKNKRKKKKKKRGRGHQQEAQKQKAEEKKDADEETGEKSLDVEIEYVSLCDNQFFFILFKQKLPKWSVCLLMFVIGNSLYGAGSFFRT